MDAETLIQRAQERCSKYLPGRGSCRSCVLEEMEEGLLEENPELSRGDCHDLVWSCVVATNEAEH